MARVLRDLSPLLHSKSLLAILLTPVFLVTGVSIFSYRIANHNAVSFGLVTHTYNVIGKLDEEFNSLLEAETSVRGYALTGRDQFLESYQTALDAVPRTLESIREMTQDNSVQQANVSRLEQLTRQKMSHAKQTLELRQKAGVDSAAENVAAGEGKLLMDQIRELMAQMKNEELRLLQIRQNQSHTYGYWVQMSCMGFLAANVLVFAGMLFLIVRIGRMHNLVKVCAWTKRVEYQGKWMRFEEYLKIRFGIKTTHGLSQEAAVKMKAELETLKSGTKI